MHLCILLWIVVATPALLLAAGPPAEETGPWQAMQLVTFTDFDDLEVVLTDLGDRKAGRRGTKHQAFLVGLRPIREAVKGKDRQDRVREGVAGKMRRSTLSA